MKIENIVFEFKPNAQLENLQITDLQKQYLADLRAQNTIEELTKRYLTNGWLVNFSLLYQLIDLLTQKNIILNAAVHEYFESLQLKNFSISAEPRKLSDSEPAYSEKKLLQLPFFRSLNPEISKYLLSQAQFFRYPAQALICRQGARQRDLFVLLKGQAAVYRQAETFKQFMAILAETSVFGEAGFLLNEPRTADVLTLKACEVLVIPFQQEILEKFLNKDKAQSLQQRFWVQHALLHSNFFKTTPSDCLDALTFAGKIIDLDDQQVLFKEGEAGHSAYVVIQGSMVVTQKNQLINTLPQGSLFGEISLILSNGQRTATLIAQRNTKLLEIRRTDFYALLAQNLYLAKEFQNLAEQRLQMDQQRL